MGSETGPKPHHGLTQTGMVEPAGNNKKIPPPPTPGLLENLPWPGVVPLLEERGTFRASHVPGLCLYNVNVPGVLISQVTVRPAEEITKISVPGGTQKRPRESSSSPTCAFIHVFNHSVTQQTFGAYPLFFFFPIIFGGISTLSHHGQTEIVLLQAMPAPS